MTHDEIEVHRRTLTQVLAQNAKPKANDPGENNLRELASEVGASVFEFTMTSSGPKWRHATLAELVRNIHQALQTASMIDTCKTAAKNHEVAVSAQESARLSQWISIGAMFAAVASAVAVWIWH